MLLPPKPIPESLPTERGNLIPKDHILVYIHKHVDFSFIHEVVRSSYCEYYGRPANKPELLSRLLFLQYPYNLSDKRVIQEAQVNLAYQWFLGLQPEDSLPHPSQLSRFRNDRLGISGVEEVLQAIVRQCKEKGIILSKTLLMDSTHTLSSSPQKTFECTTGCGKTLISCCCETTSKVGVPTSTVAGEEKRSKGERGREHHASLRSRAEEDRGHFVARA